MKVPELEIRSMSREEVDLAVDWAAREGWNPGLHDAGYFHDTDPQGFLVGLLDGQPVGCISAVSYGGTFGFVGFYIVLPAFRGQGHGLKLWRQAMARLDGHNIGLDGVVEQQDNYRKSGFRLAYRNIRYEARGGAGTRPCMHAHLRRAVEADLPLIAAYDRGFFPADRSGFLRGWLRLPDSNGQVWSEDGQLKGWGQVRQCRQGWKIGPLYAENEQIAEAIFAALTVWIPSHEPVYLDIPQPNSAALALAARHNMRKVFETARMYTGDIPPLRLDALYGVTSFELG